MERESDVSKRPNALLISETPSGWVRAVWPIPESDREVVGPTGKYVVDTATKKCSIVEDPNCLGEERKNLWKLSVGREPRDTRVTILVPVHNEERNIESFIGNFMLFDMPKEVNAHVLFVVNNCSDNSFREAVSRLGILTNSPSSEDELESKEFEFYEDEGLSRRLISFRLGNQVFKVLSTETGSKSNAMNLANKYALKEGHDVVVNLDANNYPEPDTLRTVIAATYKEVVEGDKFFVDAQPVSQRNAKTSPSYEKLIRRLVGDDPENPLAQEREITAISGWCMAWSPEKLNILGGVPMKGGDDYALGVIARALGYEEVNIQTKARVWGHACCLMDRVKGHARWHRERLQLIDYADENLSHASAKVRQILASERDTLLPISARVRRLVNEIVENPKKAPKTIARFTLHQLGIVYGDYLYKKNPDEKSWEPLRSTK